MEASKWTLGEAPQKKTLEALHLSAARKAQGLQSARLFSKRGFPDGSDGPAVLVLGIPSPTPPPSDLTVPSLRPPNEPRLDLMAAAVAQDFARTAVLPLAMGGRARSSVNHIPGCVSRSIQRQIIYVDAEVD